MVSILCMASSNGNLYGLQLHKLEEQASTPPRLVHSHRTKGGRSVQFSSPLADQPAVQPSDNSSVMDGDYLNNELCVLNANSEEGSPLNMEPLRSTSSSREDEAASTAVPQVGTTQPVAQSGTTLHSNKGAIFGPPVSFDAAPSIHQQSPPKSVSAPSVPTQPITHHIPLRRFQIPESE